MPPPIAFVPHRRTRGEIREEHNNFERDRPPAYVPTKSSDERKAELALRNEFHGKTPQEVAAAQAGPPKPRQPRAVATTQQLRNQIVDEVAERQEFLDSMAKMGKGTEYEAKIRGEIAERLADLKKLDQLEASDAEQSAQS
uniref:Uncharacterized protein n=2 Tax=Chrysotila carterae TaxID=13221 RepID=A0A7S4F5R9_CHRCT|mmetsp:Transcript_54034/g.117824  ORF Transcript_54034/g.117824 Transcript_54034/m.117824 type:complete len:141 (+) Transcript_54034:274-696(+)